MPPESFDRLRAWTAPWCAWCRPTACGTGRGCAGGAGAGGLQPAPPAVAPHPGPRWLERVVLRATSMCSAARGSASAGIHGARCEPVKKALSLKQGLGARDGRGFRRCAARPPCQVFARCCGRSTTRACTPGAAATARARQRCPSPSGRCQAVHAGRIACQQAHAAGPAWDARWPGSGCGAGARPGP